MVLTYQAFEIAVKKVLLPGLSNRTYLLKYVLLVKKDTLTKSNYYFRNIR